MSNRKCIVFIDNCRAHQPVSSLNQLKNLKVIFFPPNITSVCQPMDMGIIANLKLNYKNYLSFEKNHCLENNAKFCVTVLDAMIYLKNSWNYVKPSTIQNCFRKAQFIIKNQNTSLPNTESAVLNEVQLENLQDQLPTFEADFIPICGDNCIPDIIEDKQSGDESNEEEDEDARNINSSTAINHMKELSKFLLENKADCMQVYELKKLVYDAIDICKIQRKITEYLVVKDKKKN
jgi:hypothetical protein